MKIKVAVIEENGESRIEEAEVPDNYFDFYHEEPVETPSQLDVIEAQTMYTALMTGTLIEEGEAIV